MGRQVPAGDPLQAPAPPQPQSLAPALAQPPAGPQDEDVQIVREVSAAEAEQAGTSSAGRGTGRRKGHGQG